VTRHDDAERAARRRIEEEIADAAARAMPRWLLVWLFVLAGLCVCALAYALVIGFTS
jgi:hypothetical protein